MVGLLKTFIIYWMKIYMKIKIWKYYIVCQGSCDIVTITFISAKASLRRVIPLKVMVELTSTGQSSYSKRSLPIHQMFRSIHCITDRLRSAERQTNGRQSFLSKRINHFIFDTWRIVPGTVPVRGNASDNEAQRMRREMAINRTTTAAQKRLKNIDWKKSEIWIDW